MSTQIPDIARVAPAPVAPPGTVLDGVWRRFFAFMIDGIVLAIAGRILGSMFFEKFVQMGAWGRLAGFCVGIFYFGLFESSIGGGQSIGKRFLQLRIVDAQGKMLGVEEAILRFFVFAAPGFLDRLPLPVSRTPWVVTSLLGIVVLGIGTANLYLLTFNRGTRQGLQDFAARSFVVMANGDTPVRTGQFWKCHWIIAGAIVWILGVMPAVIVPLVMRMGPFPELLEDARYVEGIDGVQTAAMRELAVSHAGEDQSHLLSVVITSSAPEDEQDAIADEAAKRILEHDPKAMEFDTLRIEMIRGYDLGIARASTRQTFAHPPAWWQEHLQ